MKRLPRLEGFLVMPLENYWICVFVLLSQDFSLEERCFLAVIIAIMLLRVAIEGGGYVAANWRHSWAAWTDHGPHLVFRTSVNLGGLRENISEWSFLLVENHIGIIGEVDFSIFSDISGLSTFKKVVHAKVEFFSWWFLPGCCGPWCGWGNPGYSNHNGFGSHNLDLPRTQDASHHQDYYIFNNRESQPKPSFGWNPWWWRSKSYCLRFL